MDFPPGLHVHTPKQAPTGSLLLTSHRASCGCAQVRHQHGSLPWNIHRGSECARARTGADLWGHQRRRRAGGGRRQRQRRRARAVRRDGARRRALPLPHARPHHRPRAAGAPAPGGGPRPRAARGRPVLRRPPVRHRRRHGRAPCLSCTRTHRSSQGAAAHVHEWLSALREGNASGKMERGACSDWWHPGRAQCGARGSAPCWQ